MGHRLNLSTFRAEITPPIGHPLCAGWYPPAIGVEDRLFANGVVLFPEGAKPLVLCALDWAELSNSEYQLWCEALAKAAGTDVQRVALHCIHAHDTPWPDRGAQQILDQAGLPEVVMQHHWCHQVIETVAEAIGKGLLQKLSISEIRSGSAQVEGVASNRRVLGPDGKVKGIRWTRCLDQSLRDLPEGIIDPWLQQVSFWSGEKRIATLNYYTVHPTSYDGTGQVTSDFVGLARERFASEVGGTHLYFTGCAGNITCGKFNDGALENRQLFADRLLCAMREANTKTTALVGSEVRWVTCPVALPATDWDGYPAIADPEMTLAQKSRAAICLAYQKRAHLPITLSALHLGEQLILLHLPGEAFVEYQLFAQELRPDAQVATAAYGDCGPGYIPMAQSWEEGGYEPTDAFCTPACEGILKAAISKLLSK